MNINWKGLSGLFNIERLKEKAEKETKDLTTRWDVPAGEIIVVNGKEICDCPEDLRDTQGRLFRTEDGYRITGRLLTEDTLHGGLSPAIVLLPLLYGVLYLLSYSNIPQVIISAIFLCIFYSFFEKKNKLLLCSIALLPIVINIIYMSPLALYLGYMIPKGYVDAIILLGLAIATKNINKAEVSKRVKDLNAQGSLLTLETTADIMTNHIDARKTQYNNAKKDMLNGVHFVKTAIAKGITTSKFDGYSPDAGLPFGQSVNDWSTHIITIGETGCGKTELMKHHAFGAIEAGLGVAAFDGKGQFGKELWNIYKDYGFDLIEPGYCDVALIDLPPEQLAYTIAEVRESGKTTGSDFFSSSGRKWLLTASMLLHHATELEKMELADDNGFEKWEDLVKSYKDLNKPLPKRDFPKTAAMLVFISDKLNDFDYMIKGKDDSYSFLEWLGNHPKAKQKGLLKESINYIYRLQNMNVETVSNIKSTVESWLSPFFTNEEISATWCQQEEGVKIDGPLYGKGLGVCCPPSKYGDTGTLCTQLIKAQLANAIKNRPSDWKTNGSGMTQMLMLIDEAQSVISRAVEGEIIPIARSLGCTFLIATQSVDEFYSRLTKDAALAMLQNFLSFYVYRSSKETMEWVANRLGKTKVLKYNEQSLGLNYYSSARNALASPVYDKNHPLKDSFVNIKRQKKSGFIRSLFSGDSQEDTLSQEVSSGQVVIENLLTEDELDSYLANQYVAIAQVMRGGIRRRDIVSVLPPIPKEELERRIKNKK